MGLGSWLSTAGSKIWEITPPKLLYDAVFDREKLMEKVTAAKDGVVGAAVAVKDGVVWAGGKVGDGAAWVGKTSWEYSPLKLGIDAAFNREKFEEKLDTVRNGAAEVGNFAKFCATNPMRAQALVAQGVTNSVTSLVGGIGDLGVGIYNNTARHAYNLGFDKEEDKQKKIEHAYGNDLKNWAQLHKLVPDKLEAWHTEAINKLNVSQETKDWLIRNGNPLQAIDPRDPNAKYERVVLSGAQAVGDAAVFVGGVVLTAGTVSAGMAVARGSATIAGRTAVVTAGRTGAAVAGATAEGTTVAATVAGTTATTTAAVTAAPPVIAATVTPVATTVAGTTAAASSTVTTVTTTISLGEAFAKGAHTGYVWAMPFAHQKNAVGALATARKFSAFGVGAEVGGGGLSYVGSMKSSEAEAEQIFAKAAEDDARLAWSGDNSANNAAALLASQGRSADVSVRARDHIDIFAGEMARSDVDTDTLTASFSGNAGGGYVTNTVTTTYTAPAAGGALTKGFETATSREKPAAPLTASSPPTDPVRIDFAGFNNL